MEWINADNNSNKIYGKLRFLMVGVPGWIQVFVPQPLIPFN